MRNIFSIFLTIFFVFIFSSKAYSIEVSSLDAERRLEFSELFPKKVCDKIYQNSSFGSKNKLDEEVLLMNYHNLKGINLNETNSELVLFFDQRTYFYKEPKLNLLIFNSLNEDFSDQIQAVTQKIIKAKTQKIVVCEYDLKTSISEGKFFDFKISFENSTKVESSISPKILIYYDGTIEYIYYDEEVHYAIPQFNYRKYPFDDHEFKFLISSKVFENVYFEKSGKFKILLGDAKKVNYTNISFPGWTIKQYISYPAIESLTDAYSDYSKHSITSEVEIQRNWITYLFKFILPIMVIILINYGSMFVPYTFERTTLAGTSLIALVAFNLVTSTAKIPVLPYLNLFDWFMFMSYFNTILIFGMTIFESIYIGNFMKETPQSILTATGDNKIKLDRIRMTLRISVPVIFIILGIVGYQMLN